MKLKQVLLIGILLIIFSGLVSASTTIILNPTTDLYDAEIKYKDGIFDKVDTGKLKSGTKIGGTYDWERGFIQFDTSTIPTSAIISSATLGMTVQGIRTSALDCNISIINITDWYPIDATDWTLTGATINASYIRPSTAIVDTTYYQDVLGYVTKGGPTSYKLQADVESTTLDCQIDFYEFGDAVTIPNLTVTYVTPNISVSLKEPTNNFAILKNNTFQLGCNMTNNGEVNFTNSNLYARYTDTTIIPTIGGVLTLNQSGNYSCGALNINETCNRTWTVTANSFADNLQIECYGEANPTSSSQLVIRVDVMDNISNNLSIQLDKGSYSQGETSTATLTSSFTSATYNAVWQNSTGGLICNNTGTTPVTANQLFFTSCLIPNNIADQENNTVIFYIDGTASLNVSTIFNTSTIGPLEYAITNILLKYDETFLGYSQSIKATIVDNNTDIAVGECCRIQIDDISTGAPIFTSPTEIIDGAGSCETHWTLDKADFTAPISYAAMVIAWQCSNEDLPSNLRKRGTGTTSFEVNEYFTESNVLLPITNTDVYGGLDYVELTHDRTNNFGRPMEVLQTVWFSNTVTEEDYHYTELNNLATTVNVGLSSVVEQYPIPIDLPSGTYRIEKNIFYSYQGEIKEFRFVKSNNFNVTSIEDAIVINDVYVKDMFDNQVPTNTNSTYTNVLPHYFAVYGLPFRACIDYTSSYPSTVQGQTFDLILTDEYTSSFNGLISSSNEESHQFWELETGNNIVCSEFIFPKPANQLSSSLWKLNSKITYGSGRYSNSYSQATFHDSSIDANTDRYFFAAKIQDVVRVPKWWAKPNSTYIGDPGVWVQNEYGEIIQVHDDPEQKDQSQVPWGSSENCTKEDQSVNFTCNYTSYLKQGGKVKTCFKAKNYFSDEIFMNIDKLYIDEDLHDTVVELPLTKGYIENGLKSVHDPDITGCNGNCVNQSGFTYFCTEYYDLPSIMPGGNSWDVQGWLSLGRNFGATSLEWSFESDEWSLFGIKSGEGLLTINSGPTTDLNTYTGGDIIFLTINVTGYSDIPAEIVTSLEREDGLEVYTWDLIDSFEIGEDTRVITYPLLLPVLLDSGPYGGEYKIELYLNSLNGDGLLVKKETSLFNVSSFNAVISENITSGIVNNTNPITIDYELNIPTKDMMFYPNKNQPFRIKYHFISKNGSGQAISQFTTIDGQYAPLEVYTMLPADTQQNISVILQPSLPAGNYSIVQEIEIDPPVNGIPVWEGIHKGTIGSIVVSEDLLVEPRGLVETTKATYYLTKEINFTTHEIKDSIDDYINIILDEINYTINNLDFSGLNLTGVNVTVDLSSVESNLVTILSDLLTLRDAVDNSQEFSEEAVFLVTDSIIATTNAINSNSEEEFISEINIVKEKLNNLNIFDISKQKEKNKKIIIILLSSFIGGLSTIHYATRQKKQKKINNNTISIK